MSDRIDNHSQYYQKRLPLLLTCIIVIFFNGNPTNSIHYLQQFIQQMTLFKEMSTDDSLIMMYRLTGCCISLTLFFGYPTYLLCVSIGPKWTSVIGSLCHMIGLLSLSTHYVMLIYFSICCISFSFCCIMNSHIGIVSLFPGNSNIVLAFLGILSEVSVYGVSQFKQCILPYQDSFHLFLSLTIIMGCLGLDLWMLPHVSFHTIQLSMIPSMYQPGCQTATSSVLPLQYFTPFKNPTVKHSYHHRIQSIQLNQNHSVDQFIDSNNGTYHRDMHSIERSLIYPEIKTTYKQTMTESKVYFILCVWFFVISFLRRKLFLIGCHEMYNELGQVNPIINDILHHCARQCYTLLGISGIGFIFWSIFLKHSGLIYYLFLSNLTGVLFMLFLQSTWATATGLTTFIFLCHQSSVSGLPIALYIQHSGQYISTIGVLTIITSCVSLVLDCIWPVYIIKLLKSFMFASGHIIAFSGLGFLTPSILLILQLKYSTYPSTLFKKKKTITSSVSPLMMQSTFIPLFQYFEMSIVQSAPKN